MSGVRPLATLLTAAFGRGCETTLVELAGTFGLSINEHPFEVSRQVEMRLADLGLMLVPPLPKGSFDSSRMICCASQDLTLDDVMNEITRGEGPVLEFKSSLVYDVARATSGNFQNISELRSESVIDSSLKTVAAFLNTSGGVLYVGVGDNGDAVGIDWDFNFSGNSGVDGWELFLRDLIKGRFLSGTLVNNFVRVSFFQIYEKAVARIEVGVRGSISYYKKNGMKSPEVFVRQGNRTVSLTMPEFEEFLISKSGIYNDRKGERG